MIAVAIHQGTTEAFLLNLWLNKPSISRRGIYQTIPMLIRYSRRRSFKTARLKYGRSGNAKWDWAQSCGYAMDMGMGLEWKCIPIPDYQSTNYHSRHRMCTG